MQRPIQLIALALFGCALVTGCARKPVDEPYTVYKSPAGPADRDWVPPPLWTPREADPLPGTAPGTTQQADAPSIEPFPAPATAMRNEPLDEVVEDARRLGQLGDQDGMMAKLEMAAAQGSAEAHYELAKVYADGKLNGGNRALVADHLQASADLGNPEALRVLAWQLLRTEDDPAGRQRGVTMMAQAAERSLRAQRELGMLYLGLYKPDLKDAERGLDYLRAAAAGGDAEAHGQLSKALSRLGRPADAAIVGQALQQEGAAGDTAQESAEQLYERGSAMLAKGGSNENQARAYALFDMAYRKGHQMAGVELRMLSGLKAEMDRREPGWLARYQLEALVKR